MTEQEIMLVLKKAIDERINELIEDPEKFKQWVEWRDSRSRSEKFTDEAFERNWARE